MDKESGKYIEPLTFYATPSSITLHGLLNIVIAKLASQTREKVIKMQPRVRSLTETCSGIVINDPTCIEGQRLLWQNYSLQALDESAVVIADLIKLLIEHARTASEHAVLYADYTDFSAR